MVRYYGGYMKNLKGLLGFIQLLIYIKISSNFVSSSILNDKSLSSYTVLRA